MNTVVNIYIYVYGAIPRTSRRGEKLLKYVRDRSEGSNRCGGGARACYMLPRNNDHRKQRKISADENNEWEI